MNGSLCVSVLALIATVTFGILTWHHNRLSVKPYIRLDVVRLLNQDAGIKLVNAGIGPAIIESVQVQVLDQCFDANRDDWGENVMALLVARKYVPKALSVMTSTLKKGDTLGVHEEMPLVSFTDDDNNAIEKEEAHLLYTSIVHWLKFRVRYKSIYGKKFIAESQE